MSKQAMPFWKAQSPAGQLDITINLTKPEKDPRAIAAEASRSQTPLESRANRNAVDEAQPGTIANVCPLCWAPSKPGNPAYLLHDKSPVTEVTLQGEPWAWWYSPYGYFPEHLIVASLDHTPMKIDYDTIVRLLDFSDRYPEYFIGSNADLPIVGGSILAHDHFQGGRYRFPLMKAPLKRSFTLSGFPNVAAGIVQWPASTLRLQATDRVDLTDAAWRIMERWKIYNDPACAIISATEGVPHNTVNPIVWRDKDSYVLDIVLRNNRTTDKRPYGLFHPDESLFHIKKENIGLIEIMGRAILPARLMAEYPAIKEEAGRAYYRILCATGVFKQDDEGNAGWERFLATLN